LPDGSTALDVLGRNVVLAFRLSSITADFPGIVTQRELLDRCVRHLPASLNFTQLRLNKNNILKYFKGEHYGVTALYASTKPKNVKRVSEIASGQRDPAMWNEELSITSKVLCAMYEGTEWLRTVAQEYSREISEEFIEGAREVFR
jgi:hypothetical protein